MTPSIQPAVVLFDYGGVLAAEGFQQGLETLARRYGCDPAAVVTAAADAIYASGYVTGHGSEADFWAQLTSRSGLPPYRPEFTAEILDRFVLRPAMLQAASTLRSAGVGVSILSDQTDWLDRLEARDHFFHRFDRVFNSFHLGRGKRHSDLFPDVAHWLGTAPGQILFIDDNPGHIQRARNAGFRTYLFQDSASCLGSLARQTGQPLAD